MLLIFFTGKIVKILSHFAKWAFLKMSSINWFLSRTLDLFLHRSMWQSVKFTMSPLLQYGSLFKSREMKIAKNCIFIIFWRFKIRFSGSENNLTMRPKNAYNWQSNTITCDLPKKFLGQKISKINFYLIVLRYKQIIVYNLFGISCQALM